MSMTYSKRILTCNWRPGIANWCYSNILLVANWYYSRIANWYYYDFRYRERMAQVHDAVKRRLDYQVELVNTRKRFEQQHMVDWIVNNVVQGITPKQVREGVTPN